MAASNNGAGDTSGNRRKRRPSRSSLIPDTEDNVHKQTGEIFQNFIHGRYEHDIASSAAAGDLDAYEETPAFPEITNFTSDPMGNASRIGRQLALIGDDINEQYSEQFVDMIKVLYITPDTAYESFANVARRLFEDGVINWGRIVTLLCFGYRIAKQVMINGMKNFFRKIIDFIVKFIFREKIAAWIAAQGGWAAALCYVPECIGWPTLGMIVVFAAISLSVVFWISKR